MSERWAGLVLGCVCVVWPLVAAAQEAAPEEREGDPELVRPVVTLPRIKAPIGEEPQ